MTERSEPEIMDWSLTTWEGNRRAQMELWASMTLDRILEAQEEMAELSRDLARQSGHIARPSTDRGPDGRQAAVEPPRGTQENRSGDPAANEDNADK
jgi:hypothetical protein